MGELNDDRCALRMDTACELLQPRDQSIVVYAYLSFTQLSIRSHVAVLHHLEPQSLGTLDVVFDETLGDRPLNSCQPGLHGRHDDAILKR